MSRLKPAAPFTSTQTRLRLASMEHLALLVEKFTEGAKHAAQQAFDAMAAKLPDGVSFNTRFVESKSAEQAINEVIDTVRADLLVVGSHGHSGLNRLLLGSVASKLINTAKVPVLVARA